MTIDIAYDSWLKAIKADKTSVLATVLHEKDTTSYTPLRVFLDVDGEMISTIEDCELIKVIEVKLVEKLSEKNATAETMEIALEDGSAVNLFIDVYTPPVQVMIFGAGHDAIPVAKYSLSMGFHTIVVDAREAFNSKENFPHAERVIVQPEYYHEKITITKNTFIIVMNHHIMKDCETLQFALQSDAPYVGVLGPRSRREKMLNQLYEEGISFTDLELVKMYNPVGLDIGAESPEEIAISILAEIIAVSKGHEGGFLHDKNNIHKYPSKYELSVNN